MERICAIISRAELLTVDGAWFSAKLMVFSPPATVALPVAVWDQRLRLAIAFFSELS
jgi:hypothetical protein